MSEPATTTTPPRWFTALIGVVMAYVMRDRAGPIARSHYDFLISTFWWSIPPLIICSVLAVVGVVLMLVLIGFPILFAAGAVFLLWFIWFIARCIAGIYYLARGEAYPRPGAIFI